MKSEGSKPSQSDETATTNLQGNGLTKDSNTDAEKVAEAFSCIDTKVKSGQTEEEDYIALAKQLEEWIKEL